MTDRVQFALWIAQSLPVQLGSCLNRKQLQVVQSLAPAICSACAPSDRDILTRCLSFKGTDVRPSVDEWLHALDKSRQKALMRALERHHLRNRHHGKTAERLLALALTSTQTFVHEQNQERTQYFSSAKHVERMTYSRKTQWKQLVLSVSHEAHHFYDEASFPRSWQLDTCEGPSRMRRKLKRCHLRIEERHFEEGFQHKCKSGEARLPLASIFASADQNSEVSLLIDSIHANEQILLTYCCILVTPECEFSGELLLSDTCAHFIGRVDDGRHCESPGSLRQESWLLSDISEFLETRFQLQDTAIELFIENGQSHLLALSSVADAKDVVAFLSERGVSQTSDNKSLAGVTRMWREGFITNFDVSSLQRLPLPSFPKPASDAAPTRPQCCSTSCS